ncbi:MAG: CRISPR system precrRNA processing endoribonuclease RAMP protein Cas6 [Anaerolineales bacterium]|nr:CRISPR system precrRNA processing endoribonuclease RAMP protein Cas6 [Anaerolineales bacterium]
MDLLSLVLTLQPALPASLPPRLGRAAYAILLDRIARRDPALAASLHEGDGPKPVTCSDLMGTRDEDQIAPDIAYTLRYTALTAPVAAALAAAFAPGDTLTFEGVDLRIETIAPNHCELQTQPSQSTICNPQSVNSPLPPSPWPGADDYDALAARHLRPSGPAPTSAWTLLFASPTAFRSQGLTQALPLPSLVFGSLVARWNAFAPVALPEEEVRRFAQECVAISRFALRSAPGWERGQGGTRGMRIGAIGKVTYSALNRDRYWLAVFGLLAGFACYAGLGMLTTMGMGQVRAVKSELQRPRRAQSPEA